MPKLLIYRGDKVDLPTLDTGRFGLATDTEEVFVGNSGNLELLTENHIDDTAGNGDTDKVWSADKLYDVATKSVVIQATARDTAVSVADGVAYFIVPEELNGFNLVSVGVTLVTASSSGNPSFQIHNDTDSVDMLSTAMTVDANDTDTKDAETAAVIDTSNDDVATGDVIRLDCDAAGTGAAGLYWRMGFRKT